MALQGDLNSFALPDVLRLLAGTGKSGRLEIVGDSATGEVLLHEGAIHSGSVTSAPRAVSAADVVFELLRFEEGSFNFDEGDQPGGDELTDVDTAIGEAQALVAEWDAVEAVVPSMDVWISLVPEIETDTIELTSTQWRTLVAVGGGGNVRDLAADALSLTDLDASRQVKGLAEAALVAVRASHGYTPPTVELDSFEEFEVEMEEPMTDLEDLMVEDRPVVMEESEDALLPEPLPGEGVAFEGESFTGVVDGRTFDAHDGAEAAHEAPFSMDDFQVDSVLADARSGGDHSFGGLGDVDPFSETAPADEYDSATSADETAPVAEIEQAPEAEPVHDDGFPTAEEIGGGESEIDEERGSLLKFLSSVKP